MRGFRFFRRRRWDEERSREIAAYLDIETAENIARGMPAHEALFAAHRKFGNPTLIREEIYRMNTIGLIETVWQDLRHGARLLRLNPSFAVVAIASLALGIGANTAMFQLFDAIRLRTLPVKDPRQLVEVRIADRRWASGNFRGSNPQMTGPLWEQIRGHQQALAGIFAWGGDTFNLATGGQVHFARTLLVSGDFFRVLDVQPALGRVLASADDRRGCGSSGAVISYGFWRSEFAQDPSILGRRITLDAHPFEVIGVTPADFFGLEVGRNFDVAVPLCAEPVINGENSHLDKRHNWWLTIMGRPKPGWSLDRVSAHFRALSPAVLQETVPPNYTPDSVKKYLAYRLGAFPAGTGISELREDYDAPLRLLLTISGLVLLIACANLANLMLARASTRQREVAVRLAIGASRGRLVRQMLAESFLLAMVGAALGAVLAAVVSRLLVSFLGTSGNPVFVDLNPDLRVLGFTAGLAILTCLFFGLTPAVRATQLAPAAVIRASGRGLTADRERFGLRRVLVVAQVAFSLVLLVGALLFVRSLGKLMSLDAGFQQDGILIANLDFTRLNLARERRLPYKQALLERVRSIPGVQSAADANIVPISGSAWNDTCMIGKENIGQSLFTRISPAYFRTLETPMLAGRDFNQQDTIASPKVAIVNEMFGRKLLKGANPIGRTFHIEPGPGDPDPIYQIVGVVKNTKYQELKEDPQPIAYFPISQADEPDTYSALVIRSNAPLVGLVSSIKTTLAEASPDISIDFHVFKTQIRESLLRERLLATLSGLFGALAAVLATIGLYGVIAYMVARRRNEIGIRMALGADRGGIVGMVLREAGWLLAVGLVAGIVLALAAGRAAGAMLFGLKPYDPVTLALAAGALAVVALSASYLPAQRAAGMDPMIALREE